jgi:hypothetical protein
MESIGVPAQDLEAESLSDDGQATQLNTVLTEQYALGPLTEAKLWEGERAAMKLDRGPCKLPETNLPPKFPTNTIKQQYSVLYGRYEYQRNTMGKGSCKTPNQSLSIY